MSGPCVLWSRELKILGDKQQANSIPARSGQKTSSAHSQLHQSIIFRLKNLNRHFCLMAFHFFIKISISRISHYNVLIAFIYSKLCLSVLFVAAGWTTHPPIIGCRQMVCRDERHTHPAIGCRLLRTILEILAQSHVLRVQSYGLASARHMPA